MSKYFQFALVLLYVLLTILAFLIVLAASGLRISPLVQWVVVAGWVLLCFGSAYVRAGLELFLHSRFRRPIRAEEERLQPALRELLQRAVTKRRVRIWIDETRELNAVATGHHTIAISRSLLDVLTPGELRGVLAHELGHLLSGDTIAASAFVLAGWLPQVVFWVYRAGAVFVRVTRVNLLGGVIVLLIAGYLLNRVHLLQAVIPVILFVLLFTVLNRVFRFFALMLSRLAEYRQDAFAFRLGYGEGLRKVLEKFAAGSEPVVNRYFIVLHSTHPVVYNRIRRLEKFLREMR